MLSTPKRRIKRAINQRFTIPSGGTRASAPTIRKEQEQVEPPMVIPHTPLIDFLSQLTVEQRRGIRNIRLTEALGYHGDRLFSTGEELYQWLTPGRPLISKRVWPAEKARCHWFRLHLTADHVFKHAESVDSPESMSDIVGQPLTYY